MHALNAFTELSKIMSQDSDCECIQWTGRFVTLTLEDGDGFEHIPTVVFVQEIQKKKFLMHIKTKC
jgi:hypothetical protein